MKYKEWTPEDDAALRADWDAGLSLLAIARKRGWTRHQVNGRRGRIGLPRRHGIFSKETHTRRGVQMDFAIVHQQRLDGQSWHKIAANCRSTHSGVRRWYAQQCAAQGIVPVVVDTRRKKTPKPKAVKPPKPPRVKAVRPAPRPAPEKPVAAPTCVWLERGRPGVAQPPVALPWPRVREIAANEAWPLGGLHDLPAYNRSRITRGYAPLAIRRAA